MGRKKKEEFIKAYLGSCIRIRDLAFEFAILHSSLRSCIRVRDRAFEFMIMHSSSRSCIRVWNLAFEFVILHSSSLSCIHYCVSVNAHKYIYTLELIFKQSSTPTYTQTTAIQVITRANSQNIYIIISSSKKLNCNSFVFLTYTRCLL